MHSPFVRKLEFGADLTMEDKTTLEGAVTRTRRVSAREDVIRQGAKPEDVHVVLEGYACRYKMLPDGGRQIMALLVPGDFCDLHVAVLDRMDHGIATLTACTMAEISREKIEALVGHPRIARALWWATLVDEATLREWLVNMGRRSADRQTAHFFCELLHRLRAVGLAEGDQLVFPLTQEELADILGLSVVHVNRTLMALRKMDLLAWDRGVVRALDCGRLCEFAAFDPDYLHLVRHDGERPQP